MNIQGIKQYIRQQLQYIDRTYWVLFTALILVASIALFSASSFFVFQKGGSTLGPILSQMMFMSLSVLRLDSAGTQIQSFTRTSMNYIRW